MTEKQRCTEIRELKRQERKYRDSIRQRDKEMMIRGWGGRVIQDSSRKI